MVLLELRTVFINFRRTQNQDEAKNLGGAHGEVLWPGEVRYSALRDNFIGERYG